MTQVIVSMGSPDNSAIVQLRDLRLKLREICQRIEALIDNGRTIPSITTEERVRSALRARRSRDDLFGADLFADPAWDMLLELYAAALAGEQLLVINLCSATTVSKTTALRWVRALDAKGMVIRDAAAPDAEVASISLSKKAREALDILFDSNRTTDVPI